jgi:hypothetical protein
VVNAQRTGEGCFDDSWDWQGREFLGHDVDRVLITEYNGLSRSRCTTATRRSGRSRSVRIGERMRAGA